LDSPIEKNMSYRKSIDSYKILRKFYREFLAGLARNPGDATAFGWSDIDHAARLKTELYSRT